MIDFKNKNVLVCGGTGFIGLNVVMELIKNSTVGKIRVTCHKMRDFFYDQKIWMPKVELVIADLTDKKTCGEVTKGIDYLIVANAVSFGAKFIQNNPLALINANTIMNVNLFEAAYQNGIQKIVYYGSTTGYPESESEVFEDEMFKGDPFDKYFSVGWMKRYAEVLLRFYAEKLDKMDCTVLRLTNVIGPYDKFSPDTSHVTPALIKKMIDGQNPLEVWGNGQESRDIIFSKSVVEATFLAIEKVKKFQAINIGAGDNVSVKQIIDIIKESEGLNPKIKYMENNSQMIKFRAANVSKAKQILGFNSELSIKDSIRETIRWYKDNREDIYR